MPDLLFPCIFWSRENKCCKAFYDSQIVQKYFSLFKSNPDNFDSECQKNCGKSNISKCVSYQPDSRITYYVR